MSTLRPARSRMQSKSHSRPRLGSRRATSTNSVPYLPQGPSALVVPEGDIGQEAAELLHEFVHPHSHADDPIEPEEPSVEQDRAHMASKPWWKRPTPWWYLFMMPLSSIAGGATMAPRIEILTMLACDQHKPEYTAGHGMDDLGIHLPRWANRGSGNTVILSDSIPVASSDAPSFWSMDDKADSTDTVYFVNEIGDGNTTVPNPALCKTDPVVQRAVAKLSTAMTTTGGILGVITVGRWAALSDRVGRTRIVGVTILGVLVVDFTFILVALFSKRLPGGYWFLMLGPIVEGSLGGLGAASAAIHAYISDTTEPIARARVFSLNLGVLFTGIAIGPTVGGLLRRTTSSALTVFYFATAVHMLYALINWTVLPESLSPARRRAAWHRHAQARVDARKAAADRARARGVWAVATRTARSVFGFAEPLTVFLPVRVQRAGSPRKAGRRNWSLTLVGLGHMFVVMVMGSLSFKFQYAQATYNWTSEELGYWLSSIGAARAIHLTLILPIVLKIFKPKPPPIQLPVEPEEPLDAATPDAGSPAPPKRVEAPSSMTFDLALARVSLTIDIAAYICMPLAPSGVAFTAAAMLGSLGSGFSPALQSIALELYGRRGGTEAGRLFGAMSVLSALGASVFGPAIFGFVYLRTVGWFPQAIFFTTAGTVTISFVLLSFIRLPKDEDRDEEEGADFAGGAADDELDPSLSRVDREETLVDTGALDGVDAPGPGRKTVTVQE